MKTSTPSPGNEKIPVVRKLVYSAIIMLGFFGFLESALRLSGVGQPPIVGKLQFGYETGIPVYDSDGIEKEGAVFVDLPLFEHDSRLFWRPIAGTPFTGPRGFRKPEPDSLPSTSDSMRIVVIGDSCSFLGQPPYPGLLAELLQPVVHRDVQVFNASCPGYSTEQGVLQLEKVEELKPDLVIVFFGWNDHWNSLNSCTDHELVKKMGFAQRTESILGKTNTYWFLRSLMSTRTDDPPDHRLETVRVPLSDYESNLRTMAERFGQWNCRAVFVTAPSGFSQGNMPEWSKQFFGQFYKMSPQQVENIPEEHGRYNQVVRSVVSAYENCSVCDLEIAFQNRKELFRSDCIHLSNEGHLQAAEQIIESIRKSGISFKLQ